jgi:hypothetical protein
MGRGARLLRSGPIWLPRWAAAGFGETTGWLGVSSATDEVYLVRLDVKGARLDTPADALKFARAVGQIVATKLETDVRGVAVSSDGAGTHIDVVMTADKSGISLLVPSEEGLREAIEADPELRRSSPALVVSRAQLLRLTGPADAIDHWRSQPLLWDRHLGSAGGPTDTFATPAEYSVVKGRADDGKRAEPWRLDKPGLGPDDKKKAGQMWPWVLGILAAAAVSYHFGKEKRR